MMFEVHGPTPAYRIGRFTSPERAIEDASRRIYTSRDDRAHAIVRLEAGKNVSFVYGFSEVTIYARRSDTRRDDKRISTRSRRDNGDRGADFIRDVDRQLDIGDRQVRMRSDRGTVFITLINLPSGVGRAGGGAEAENNRMLLAVRGFDREPGGKVKVETLVSNLYKDNIDRRENHVSVRGRTGTEQAIARYVAESLNRIVREVPPNFTHTNRDRGSRRLRRRTR